jgi:hypothetical protein
MQPDGQDVLTRAMQASTADLGGAEAVSFEVFGRAALGVDQVVPAWHALRRDAGGCRAVTCAAPKDLWVIAGVDLTQRRKPE